MSCHISINGTVSSLSRSRAISWSIWEEVGESAKIDPRDDLVLNVLADKDDHVIDALRYATGAAQV